MQYCEELQIRFGCLNDLKLAVKWRHDLGQLHFRIVYEFVAQNERGIFECLKPEDTIEDQY